MSSIAEIKTQTETKMTQSLAALGQALSKIRTGRANPGLLDAVMVDYYGNPTPIGQVANVSLLDARTISVQPWEKGMGAKIEKAIRDSDLGLNPASMGDLIRVPMPAMSEERRREMSTSWWRPKSKRFWRFDFFFDVFMLARSNEPRSVSQMPGLECHGWMGA